jgi:RNA polymerase sigma-70 factor (ECF subfamily)
MSMDENDWIEKVLRGDAAAFEGLVRKYQARLVAFLWNLLGSGDDARDAAQDAFVQAYAGLDRFDRSRSFKSWLFAIAYNRGIDLLRKKRSFHRFWQREAFAGDPFASKAEAGPIEESLLWRPLLGRITPQERSVLALKCNEGCETDEIAAMLGCSETTVRVHLLHARRKLRKELHAAGFVAASKKPNAEEVP